MSDDKKAVTKPNPPKKRLPIAGASPIDPLEAKNADALMATTLRAMEWAAKRQKQLIYAAGALVVVAAGATGWWFYRSGREVKATELVAVAMAAEAAPVRIPESELERRLVTTYATDDARQKAALASYAEARTKYGDTGPGILARLGEAGVYLDRREYDQAIAAYKDVRASAIAVADANVRMRCLEGLGYAQEGKGLLDDARQSFDAVANVDTSGAKPLGLYHLARIDVAKGAKDPAINKLKLARDAVEAPGTTSHQYLREQIDKLLLSLDRSAVPRTPPGGPGGLGGMRGLGGRGALPGGGKFTQEQLQELIKQYQEKGGKTTPPTPPGAPPAAGGGGAPKP